MLRSDLVDFREALHMNWCAARTSKRWLRDILGNHPVRAGQRNGRIFLMARPPLLKNGGDCIGPLVALMLTLTFAASLQAQTSRINLEPLTSGLSAPVL